ncbi:hypothetical protein HN51_000256 [Arachis hypogaea]
MVMSFCTRVGASTTHACTTLSSDNMDDVRVMMRKSMDDPGIVIWLWKVNVFILHASRIYLKLSTPSPYLVLVSSCGSAHVFVCCKFLFSAVHVFSFHGGQV